MASGPGTDVKMFATGLAAGILLDATVIRALIVPAVISLMGRWNWWLPAGRPAAAGRAVAPETRGDRGPRRLGSRPWRARTARFERNAVLYAHGPEPLRPLLRGPRPCGRRELASDVPRTRSSAATRRA